MEFDADTIRAALDLVTKGSNATGSALKVIDQFKTLIGSSKQGQPDEGLPRKDVEELVTALMSQVQDARLANIELKSQLVELKEQALSAQRTAEEFERYELWKTSLELFVYRLKPEASNGEDLHYICPKCKEEGKKSILQGGRYAKRCTTCNVSYHFEKKPTTPLRRV